LKRNSIRNLFILIFLEDYDGAKEEIGDGLPKAFGAMRVGNLCIF
jgi:hypothetical protein